MLVEERMLCLRNRTGWVVGSAIGTQNGFPCGRPQTASLRDSKSLKQNLKSKTHLLSRAFAHPLSNITFRLMFAPGEVQELGPGGGAKPFEQTLS